MADRKISDLTALTAPASGDYLPIVDISEAAAANKNKRITIEELMRGAPDGTFGAPGFAFESDPNTGIYSPGADQLAISTNGAGRLFVDASGNVGVGTASEPRRLHVSNGYSAATSIDGSIALLVTNNAGANDFAGVGIIGGGTSGGSFIHFGDTANAGIGRIGYFHSDDSFRFNTNGSERLRITSTGTVNIVGAGTAGSTQAISFNGSAPVNSLVVDSSGRCGIGTSSPTHKFTVNSDAASPGTIASFKNTALNYVFLELADQTGDATYLGSANGKFVVQTPGDSYSTKLCIDSSGRVGIGTQSPDASYRTTIAGSRSGVGPGIYFSDTDASPNNYVLAINGSKNFVIRDQTNASDRFTVDTSGRILVGTSTSRATYGSSLSSAFQVEGTTYNTSSISVIRNQGGFGAGITLAGTGGTTLGSVTAVSNNNGLGGISFQGSDGAYLIEAAGIYAEVDGTPGANDMPGRLVFSTTADGASSPTERGRITNAGYWKLTSNNTYVSSAGAFHEIVHGATGSSVVVSAENASFAAGVMQLRANRATTDSTFNALEYYNAGSAAYRFFVRDSGNVQNTNNSYGAISDIKLKENIVDATSQWADIKALQVRKYNFKEGQTHTQIGLIAQEVELVSPGLVNESPDRDADGNDLGTVTKSVNYSVLYMKAVKALQEAMERIEQLEARLTAAGID